MFATLFVQVAAKVLGGPPCFCVTSVARLLDRAGDS